MSLAITGLWRWVLPYLAQNLPFLGTALHCGGRRERRVRPGQGVQIIP